MAHVQVATIFKLSRDDLTDWPQVTQAVQQMLASQSSYKAAVHLLMHFEVGTMRCKLALSGGGFLLLLVVVGQGMASRWWH